MQLDQLKIKNTWEDVLLKDFMMIKEITEDEYKNELEKEVAILAVLAGVDENYFDEYPVTEIKKVMRSLDFLETEPKADIQDYYTIGGIKYKLIKEVKDITVDRFNDLSSYIKDKNLLMDNLHLSMTTLLIPVKQGKKKEKLEKYLESPLEFTAENIWNNMRIVDAMGIQLFFCLLCNFFSETTRIYLEEETKLKLNSVLKTLKPMESNPKIKIPMETIRQKIGSL